MQEAPAIFDVFSIFSHDRDDAIRLCEELSQEADNRVIRGGGLVSFTNNWLRSIPFFVPHSGRRPLS